MALAHRPRRVRRLGGLPRSERIPREVRDAFLNSAEAKAKTTDKQFVTRAYRQILKRAPDTGGFNYWMQQLESGTPRGVVRDGFINSLELKYHDLANIKSQYRAILFDFSGRL